VSINDLYHKARQGDTVAREELYRRLYVSFRLFVRHRRVETSESEELVQAAIVKITERFDTVEIRSSFAAWAQTVLRNEIAQMYRTRASHLEKLDQLGKSGQIRDCVEHDEALRRQLSDCLKKLNDINGRHARILNLHYQGFSTEEICARLSIKPNNLYVILSRARTMLKNCLATGDLDQ